MSKSSKQTFNPTQFKQKVLAWFDLHGRKDLPWQQNINPYRVWVSEIMLQQTQVATVIPYFQRFIAAFPTVKALAQAHQDKVLHLWTGLGYYARARNLHSTAQKICREHKGVFPHAVEELAALPGIGRSTAGAICSIAWAKPATILDGNVKRVLARHRMIAGWPGQSDVLKTLWKAAEQLTNETRPGEWSQAIMDLGATVCTRSSPGCERCPVQSTCLAHGAGTMLEYPGKKPRKALPIRSTQFLMLLNAQHELWLERRPPQGIWGGLWCFPEIPDNGSASDWCLDKFGVSPAHVVQWEGFRHTFSHYHLDIKPLQLSLPSERETVMESNAALWYNTEQPPDIGLAAPVARLLQELANNKPLIQE